MKFLWLLIVPFLVQSDAPAQPHCLIVHVIDRRVMVSPDMSDTTYLVLSYIVSDMGETGMAVIPVYPDALMCYRNQEVAPDHPRS